MYQIQDSRQRANQALQGAASSTSAMMRKRPQKSTTIGDVVEGALGAYSIYDEGKDLLGFGKKEAGEILVSDLPANDPPAVFDNMMPISQTGEPVMAAGAEALAEPIVAPVIEAAMPMAGGAVAPIVTEAVTMGVAGAAIPAAEAAALSSVAATGAAAAVPAMAMAGPLAVFGLLAGSFLF